MTNSSNNKVSIIPPAQALMSLRDSGYSFPTAIAEVIDNSLEANANNIKICLFEAVNNNKKKHIDRVAVSDDGIGMSLNILHHYLVIGHSTRWMREDTIGKYGVGAKLAALNYALKIECWSKQETDNAWHYVSFDLEEALELEKNGKHEEIGVDEPLAKEIPEEYRQMVPNGSGTLVIWSKVDRLVEGRASANTEELKAELIKELGRIFRVFINNGIKITLDDRKIVHYDPLMRMEDSWSDIILTKELRKTDKENAPKKGINIHFPATVIAEDVPLLKKGQKFATLTVTLNPREVIRRRFSGGDELAQKLRVKDSEGLISFMRLGREISYTNVPRIFGREVKDRDRHIGIEVSFTPEFDKFFGVRNVKRGVEPFDELRTNLREELRPYLSSAIKNLTEAWDQADAADKSTGGEFNPLLEAVADVDKTMPKNQGESGKSEEESETKFKQELEELAEDTGHAETEEEKTEYVKKNKDLPFVLESSSFPGKSLMDIKHINKKVIIRLNTRHRFYKEIWANLKALAEQDPGNVSGADAVHAAHRAVEGLTLMVVAFAKAQAMDRNPDQYEDLTAYWGQFTDTLLGKIKDIM